MKFIDFDKNVTNKCINIILNSKDISNAVQEICKNIAEEYVIVLTVIPKDKLLDLLSKENLIKMIGRSDYINKCLGELNNWIKNKN